MRSWPGCRTSLVRSSRKAARRSVKDERSWGGYAFFRPYRTADGRHVALGGVEHKFVINLLTALGRADLIDAACGPPGPGQAPVKAFLEETFAADPRRVGGLVHGP